MKVIEGNINYPFVLLEEYFFDIVLLYKKITKWNSKTRRIKFYNSSPNHKVSGKSFMYNKVYCNKFIIITFILQIYILIVIKKFHFTVSRVVID
jgi:hypothetical protein